MKRITIEVTEAAAASLHELAARCTEQNKCRDGFTTHGSLSVPLLLTMLAEDAAMIITRPGSWEGANMAQVFISHGYNV